jgi:hypothetical protein
MDKVLQAVFEVEQIPGRDLFVVARFMIPTDAHVACGCLVACGIPAVLADANHAQAYDWMIPAMGGVRVLVPQQYLQEAQDVLAARERGELALDDDTDVGSV